MSSKATISSVSKCPRCGYDLRGTIASWLDSCPLTGTCTECGLQFNWPEVLRPEKFEPQWCVEFVLQWRRIAHASLSTFIRSIWPPGFWSALKMSMTIRWRRLLVYMALLLVPIILGYTVLQTTAAARERYQAQQRLDDDNRRSQQSLPGLQQWLQSSEVQALDAQRQQELSLFVQRLQQQANATYTVNHSYLAAITEALFSPWRSYSQGSISGPWGTSRYVAPRELHLELLGPGVVLTSVVALVLDLWVWVLLPLSFILLPVSRRRAKVRWSHLLRVTCYGCFVPSVVVSAALVSVSAGYAYEQPLGDRVGAAHLMTRYLMIPMLVIWWAVAIKKYLKIPHGWGIALLLSILLFLLFLAVLWFIASDFLLSQW